MVGGTAVLMQRNQRVRPRHTAIGNTRDQVAAEEDGPGRVVFEEGWVLVIVITTAVAFATVSVGKEVFATARRGGAFEARENDGGRG